MRSKATMNATHTLLFLLPLLQTPGGPPTLNPGELLKGEITDQSHVVETPTLKKTRADATVVGETFRFQVPESGPWHLDLRSYFFDAYLVLRDAEGQLLAEDDDGLAGTQSRITLEKLQSGQVFRAEACALKGGRGLFTLTLTPGIPPALSAKEKALADIADGRKRVEIVEKDQGPESPALASALNGLATIFFRQGGFEQARIPLECSLAVQENIFGSDHPGTASTRNNLGLLYMKLGLYERARPLLEQVLALREKTLGPEHPGTAASLNSLAGLFNDQGLYEKAGPLFERTLQIQEKMIGPENPRTIYTLINLAVVLLAERRLDEARTRCEQALSRSEKVLGPLHAVTIQAVSTLAAILSDQGNLSEARPLYERALGAWEKTLGPSHPQTAAGLNNLALFLKRQGLYTEALPLYQRARTIWEKTLGPEHPRTARALDNLAVLLADLEKNREAWEMIRQAVQIRQKHLGKTLWALSESERFPILAAQESSLNSLLGFPVPHGVSQGPVLEALLAWKGVAGRASFSSREKLSRILSPDQRVLWNQFRHVEGQLSREVYAPASGGGEVRERRLRALLEERNSVEVRLNRSLGPGAQEEPPSWKALQASLPERAAFLDFFVHQIYRPAVWKDGQMVLKGSWGADHLEAWVVRGGQEDPARIDLGEVDPIETRVHSFLASLQGDSLVLRGGKALSPSGKNPEEEGAHLRSVLWDPLASILEDVETVFVSPDSFLGGLPFEVIPLEDGTFLVEHFAFSYSEDVSVLRQETDEPTNRFPGILLAGGFDYGPPEKVSQPASAASSISREGLGIWNPLPATAREAEGIRSLYERIFPEERGSRLLKGGAPTEAQLKQEMPHFGSLHLATHGFFNPEGLPSMWEESRKEAYEERGRIGETRQVTGRFPGLLSGLVCAGSNDPRGGGDNDGFLTAEEVSWLDLHGCDLVVLSACETGLGRPQSGEGMMSLRRAFHMAGVRTVVSSLWQVKDESTTTLMLSFYRNLWQRRQGKLEALRNAQLEMLARNRREHQGHALPRTWGAFVLSGDWR